MSIVENKYMEKDDIIKLIEEKIVGFTRRVGDTPTDNLQLVNRRYVNLNGTTSKRPNASIASVGQQYFDTTIGRPIYFNPNSSVWTDGAGSIS